MPGATAPGLAIPGRAAQLVRRLLAEAGQTAPSYSSISLPRGEGRGGKGWGGEGREGRGGGRGGEGGGKGRGGNIEKKS